MNKLSKKQKIEIVKRYYGMTTKQASEYVKNQNDISIFETMQNFFDRESKLSFYED